MLNIAPNNYYFSLFKIKHMKLFSSNSIVTLSFIFLLAIFYSSKTYSQKISKTDSVINDIMNDDILSGPNDQGMSLIKDSKFMEATQYYNTEIKKDAGNTSAYFNRGVSQWQMKDESNACKDWSALLALGDTAAFKLLDSKCHGTMVVENDTLKKAEYHKIFAVKQDDKTMSNNSGAMMMVEQMPEYKGGIDKLLAYLQSNIKYPVTAKEHGTVIVNFIVSTKGTILFPYVKKGIGAACDAEALRVVRNMPAWNPGKQSGKPVLVRYNLPVKF